MIISLRMGNFAIFKDKVEISFEANGYIKKLIDNVYQSNGYKVVKSACIYGPNNVGKTHVVNAIMCLRHILLGGGVPELFGIAKNFYSEDEVISLGMTILFDNKVYSFDFDYLEKSEKYPRGRFVKEDVRVYNETKHQFETIYHRDVNGENAFPSDKSLTSQLKEFPRHNIFPYVFDKGTYMSIDSLTSLLYSIGASILIFMTPDNSPSLTISELKGNDKSKIKFIKKMITSIDVGIDDFLYEKNENNPIYQKILREDSGLAVRGREQILDQCSLYSVHSGKKVESIAYDSRGTKEIISLSSYVVEALLNNLTLVIDEFDSGLHSAIMREIVSMFNNGTNHHAQLLFTIQDMELMDTKTLFRKDQIWFLHREKMENKNEPPELYLYRLDDFKANDDGIRSETDIVSKYRAGLLGAVPVIDPNFIDIMRDILKQAHE